MVVVEKVARGSKQLARVERRASERASGRRWWWREEIGSQPQEPPENLETSHKRKSTIHE
jgi:hypothetical protein